MATTKFKGPGHWRSQAEAGRRLDGNVFAELDEMARRLHDKGLDEAEAQVRKAMEAAREDPDKAAELLAGAAQMVIAEAPAHAQGMAEMGRQLPRHSEPSQARVSDDDGIPGMHLQ